MKELKPYSSYITTFDAVRCFAAGAVVLDHSDVLRCNLTQVAMKTFFILSGTLITRRMIHGRDKYTLGQFMSRRAIRIIPANFLMIAVAFWRLPQLWLGALMSVLYVSNLRPPNAWAPTGQVWMHPYMSHTWSLSVEEAYYCIWPFLFYKLGFRKALAIAVGYLVLVWSMLLLGPLTFFGEELLRNDNFLDHSCMVCFAPLAIGCILAFIDPFLIKHGWKVLLCGAVLATWATAITTTVLAHQTLLMNVQALGIILMAHGIWSTDTWIRVALDNPVFRGLGTISYGLYLYNIMILGNWTIGWGDSATSITITGWTMVAATVLIATASYLWFEKPLLNLRDGKKTA